MTVESIMYAALPDGGNSGNEAGIMTEMDCAKEIIVGVRSVRAQKNLPNKERLTLNVVDGAAPSADMQALISKMANLEAINAGAAKMLQRLRSWSARNNMMFRCRVISMLRLRKNVSRRI